MVCLEKTSISEISFCRASGSGSKHKQVLIYHTYIYIYIYIYTYKNLHTCTVIYSSDYDCKCHEYVSMYTFRSKTTIYITPMILLEHPKTFPKKKPLDQPPDVEDPRSLRVSRCPTTHVSHGSAVVQAAWCPEPEVKNAVWGWRCLDMCMTYIYVYLYVCTSKYTVYIYIIYIYSYLLKKPTMMFDWKVLRLPGSKAATMIEDTSDEQICFCHLRNCCKSLTINSISHTWKVHPGIKCLNKANKNRTDQKSESQS